MSEKQHLETREEKSKRRFDRYLKSIKAIKSDEIVLRELHALMESNNISISGRNDGIATYRRQSQKENDKIPSLNIIYYEHEILISCDDFTKKIIQRQFLISRSERHSNKLFTFYRIKSKPTLHEDEDESLKAVIIDIGRDIKKAAKS